MIVDRDATEPDDVGRIRDALDAAEVGIWDWTIPTGDLVWDETIARLHGVDPATFDGTMEAFLARVHPDDRRGLEEAINDAVAAGGSFLTEFRVVRPTGETRWIQGRGAAIPGPTGVATRMVGLGMDTTELRSQRERAGRSVEFASDGLAILDPDWCVAFVNPAAAKVFDRSANELVGTNLWKAFPESVGTYFWDELMRAAETLEPTRFRAYSDALSGWFELDVFPAPDGLTVFFRNIDAVVAAEAERERLVRELEWALVRERQLQETTARLADALSISEVAQAVLASTRRALDTSFAGIALVNEAAQVLEFVNRDELPAATREEWGSVPLTANVPITLAARNGQSFFHESSAQLVADFPHLRDAVEASGRGAFANVPILSGRLPIGVLALSWPGDREFSDGDRDFLATVSGLCAQAIERAQVIERERATARLLQRAILPELRNAFGDVRCAGRYLPADLGIDVGGDWYDVFRLADGSIAIAIGDVAGHGLRAAATMTELRNMLRAYAFEGRSPSVVLRLLDAILGKTGSEQFATCFYAQFEPSSRELTFANAGHPAPVLITPEEPPTLLETGSGPLLGAGGTMAEGSVVLADGARLLLYTDGLVESRSRPLQDGIDGMIDKLLLDVPPDLEALCDRVIREARVGRREDDVCVLAVDFG